MGIPRPWCLSTSLPTHLQLVSPYALLGLLPRSMPVKLGFLGARPPCGFQILAWAMAKFFFLCNRYLQWRFMFGCNVYNQEMDLACISDYRVSLLICILEWCRGEAISSFLWWLIERQKSTYWHINMIIESYMKNKSYLPFDRCRQWKSMDALIASSLSLSLCTRFGFNKSNPLFKKHISG